MVLIVEPDFEMPVREGYHYVDFFTWPNEPTKILVGQCVLSPFWWSETPIRLYAPQKHLHKAHLHVEVLHKNWWTQRGELNGSRYLLWRIEIPENYQKSIVLWTDGACIHNATHAPYWEEPRIELLFTQREAHEP